MVSINECLPDQLFVIGAGEFASAKMAHGCEEVLMEFIHVLILAAAEKR